MKISDPRATPELVERMFSNLIAHTEVLRGQQISAGDRAQKYLFAVNAGGVVATLSFMGTMPSLRTNPIAWCVLGLFVTGVVLCGVVAAIVYHTTEIQLAGWIADLNRFVRGEIDAEDPAVNLGKAIQRHKNWAPAVGYIAFLAFAAGSALALWRLHP